MCARASGEPPQMPLRPTLPPLLWVAVAAWLGAGAGESLTRDATFSAFMRAPVALVAWCVAVVMLAFALRSRAAVGSLVVLALGAAVVSGSLFWLHRDADAVALQAAGRRAWTVEVLNDASKGRFGSYSRVRIVGPVGNGAIATAEWPEESIVPEIGMLAEVTGTASISDGDYALRERRAGVAATIKVKQVAVKGWARSPRGLVGPLRIWCKQRLSAVPGEGGALLDGVVLGDRRRLADSQAETAFKTTGLTHLVAVSGSHLVVVAALFGALLSAARFSRLWRTALVAVVLGGYVAFSGVQASAARAWVMALAVSAAGLSGRRSSGAATLAIAVAAMILVAPSSAYDLGFQLSVAAVAGLVVFGRLIEAWLAVAVPLCPKAIGSAIALTLTATLSTVPLTTPIFGALSLVSPLANLLVGPIVSALLLLGLAGIAASAVCAPLGSFVLHVAGACGSCAASIASYLAGWPRASVPLRMPAAVTAALLGLAIALWAGWPRPTRFRARCAAAAVVVGILLIAWAPRINSGPELIALDVGQGDALLVRDGASCVLVDTGPSESALRDALAREGVRQLDAVVITHLHDDHYGGLGALEGLVQVGVVAFAQGALDDDSPAIPIAERVSASPLKELEAGERLNVGEFTLDVLWPREPVKDAAENNASVVLLATCQGRYALLTGDAESDVLTAIGEQQPIGDLDVLKVGHHGSADAVDAESMRALRPELALISVGDGNRFGHPVAATLEILGEGGAQVARTDRSGDLTVRFSEDAIFLDRGQPSDQTRISPPLDSPVCAKLTVTIMHDIVAKQIAKERNGTRSIGSEIGLPHLRQRAPPAGASSRAAEAKGR